MKKATDESPIRRFVIPSLAICGSCFMVLSAVISYKTDVLYFLIVLILTFIVGSFFAKPKDIS